MPVNSNFQPISTLYASNLNLAFANTVNILGDNITGTLNYANSFIVGNTSTYQILDPRIAGLGIVYGFADANGNFTTLIYNSGLWQTTNVSTINLTVSGNSSVANLTINGNFVANTFANNTVNVATSNVMNQISNTVTTTTLNVANVTIFSNLDPRLAASGYVFGFQDGNGNFTALVSNTSWYFANTSVANLTATMITLNGQNLISQLANTGANNQTAINAYNQANTANSIANSALPLTGGILTGGLTTPSLNIGNNVVFSNLDPRVAGAGYIHGLQDANGNYISLVTSAGIWNFSNVLVGNETITTLVANSYANSVVNVVQNALSTSFTTNTLTVAANTMVINTLDPRIIGLGYIAGFQDANGVYAALMSANGFWTFANITAQNIITQTTPYTGTLTANNIASNNIINTANITTSNLIITGTITGNLIPITNNLFTGVSTASQGRNVLGIPINGVSVLDYGAIDDGLGDYYYGSFTQNQNKLTIYSSNAAITITNDGPGGVGRLIMSGSNTGNFMAPKPSWSGKPIAITGAGSANGTYVGVVSSFIFDVANNSNNVIILSSAVPTLVNNTIQQIACPCFIAGNEGTPFANVVGKRLWTNNGNAPNGLAYATLPFVSYIGTISSINSPFSVNMDTNFGGASVANNPTLAIWGTNNSTMIINAGAAAFAQRQKHLMFPGFTVANSTGMFCAFDYSHNQASGTYSNAGDYGPGLAISALKWINGSGVKVFNPTVPVSGALQDTQLAVTGVPWDAEGPGVPKITIDAINHWPRCSTLSTINVLVMGDSWSNRDPTGQGNAVWGPFAKNLIQRNPSRKFNFVATGVNGLTWNDLTYSIASQSIINFNGTFATPDLVCVFITGGNDGVGILRNSIATVVNTIKGWPTKNGYPPDIVLINSVFPRTQIPGSFVGESTFLAHEYSTVLQRSFARKYNIAILDYGRFGNQSLRGWSEDSIPLEHVIPPNSGIAAPYTGYVLPYLSRDWFFAIKLGSTGQSGNNFWSNNQTVQLSLGPKPDNRIIVGTDPSGNLNVMATTQGLVVNSPISININSNQLSTNGQIVIPTPVTTPSAPGFVTLANSAFTSNMVGQCILITNGYDLIKDFRSTLVGFTHSGIMMCCDPVTKANSLPKTTYVGGQMFIQSDANANADIIIAGAGNSFHMLTGANSLVTNVASFISMNTITLATNSLATVTSNANVFLGTICQVPTYSLGINVLNDISTTSNPVLTIKKTNSHIKIGYILGGNLTSDIKMAINNFENIIWEGEVEVHGGPYIPQIWTTNSANVAALYTWIGNPFLGLRKPTMTMLEAFGMADPSYTYLFGGDGGHPGHLALTKIFDDVSSTQNLALPPVNNLLTINKIQTVTANTYNITNSDCIIVVNKPIGSPTSIYAPANPLELGVSYIIKDGKGDASGNNITIFGNGANIDGSANTIINTNRGYTEITWDGTQWDII